MKFEKHSVSHNDLSRRKVEQMSRFPKNLRNESDFDLKLSYRLFRIAQAILSDVDLRCEVKKVFYRHGFVEHVIFGKTYGF